MTKSPLTWSLINNKFESAQEQPPAKSIDRFSAGDQKQLKFIKCYCNNSVIIASELPLQPKTIKWKMKE